MKQGKTKKRIFFGVLSVTLVGVSVLLRFIASGLDYNFMVSTYGRFFGSVVARAIVLEQYGDLGILTKHNYHDPGVQLPSEWQNAREVLGTFFDSGHSFDCDAGIELSQIDAEELWPELGTMLSYKPFRYVVIFKGPVPDIEPFFDKDRNSDLIGPLAPLPRRFEADDFRRDFEAILSHHPAGIRWSLKECEGFSYFEFRENENGT